MTGTDQEAIGRIDERTILIAERLENMMDHIDKLNKSMYVGNGTESVLVRLSKLEVHQAEQMRLYNEFKKTILEQRPPANESLVEQLVRQQGDALKADDEVKKTEVEIKKTEAERNTLIASKRWEFWLLIATAFTTVFHTLASVIAGIPKP